MEAEIQQLVSNRCLVITRVVVVAFLLAIELTGVLICEGERVRDDICAYSNTTLFARPCTFVNVGAALTLFLVAALLFPERLFGMGAGRPRVAGKKTPAEVTVIVSSILVFAYALLLSGLLLTVFIQSVREQCVFSLDWIAFGLTAMARGVLAVILVVLFVRLWIKICRAAKARVAQA